MVDDILTSVFGIDFSSTAALSKQDKFVVPTNLQVCEWLKQTKGILTNEMRLFIGFPSDPSRAPIKYSGPLTLPQQIYVFHQLNNNE